MGIVDFILRRPSVYSLRKKYDRLREKADRVGNISRRVELLRMLDQLEPSITSLEEHQMSRYEKKRTTYYAESNLRKIKFMLDESKKKEKPQKEYVKGR